MGNVISVVAAASDTEQNTTTMTYNSVGQKRSMTDPDMGYWTYQYDKMGNLRYQTDAKYQTVEFQYDALNRPQYKIYPDRTVTYTYDDPSVPYSKGMQTAMSDPSGGVHKIDEILAFDLMQRPILSEKIIGSDTVTMSQSYDSAGRPYQITYFPGDPSARTFQYEFDTLGNMRILKDVNNSRNLVEYNDFTAVGQYREATFPKSGTQSVVSEYTYDAVTKRLSTLKTRKFNNGSPVLTYQNLGYQTYDNKGAIATLVDYRNGLTHTFTRDSLDRLETATGT